MNQAIFSDKYISLPLYSPTYAQWRLPAACVWGGLCVNAYGERRAEEKVKQVK